MEKFEIFEVWEREQLFKNKRERERESSNMWGGEKNKSKINKKLLFKGNKVYNRWSDECVFVKWLFKIEKINFYCKIEELILLLLNHQEGKG